MDEWSRRLARVRTALNMRQGRFADWLDEQRISASQSDISRWEAGEKPVPDSIQKLIKNEEAKRNLHDEAFPFEEELHTAEFCYGATTFRRVWGESKKRIKTVAADAIIRPCRPKVAGFANIELTIRFEGVVLPKNDPLYLDCLGVMPELKWEANSYSFDRQKGSVLSWVPSPESAGILGTVEEVKKVQANLGPYAIGYQLLNVVEEETVVVTIKGERGVRTDQIDAVGVPVYADCPVESLSLSVTFENLTPHPPPKAQVYLLRRTLVDSRPLYLVGGLDVKNLDETRNKYSFQNLRFPRPGFGFCIAWGSLK